MTDQPTERESVVYDAIDAFQRTHRLPGLQHAQIRGLLAEHLARVLPAAFADLEPVVPVSSPPPDQTADRAAVLREAAEDLATAFGDPMVKHIGAIAASHLRRRARELEGREAVEEQPETPLEKRFRYSERRNDELRAECKRRGKTVLEYAEKIERLEKQLDEVRTQLGAEILRAGQTEATLERIREAVRRLANHAVGFQDVLDDSDRDPWAKTVGADIAELRRLAAEAQQESGSGCAHCVCCHTWGDREAHAALVRDDGADARQPETCRNCQGSGLDPRYNGEYACPDCSAEAPQPEEEAELVCVDECGFCDACGMEPFGTPAEGWREAARFLRRTPRDSTDFPGALRGARLIEDELRRRAEAPQPDTEARCSCGGWFLIHHLHADDHQPAVPVQPAADSSSEEAQFGVPGCTCKPWTVEHGKRRFMEPGETVDRISGWHVLGTCPHHGGEEAQS